MLCAMRGYGCIITTSQKCSEEKMNSIKVRFFPVSTPPHSCRVKAPVCAPLYEFFTPVSATCLLGVSPRCITPSLEPCHFPLFR
jgi:hypothetical protein